MGADAEIAANRALLTDLSAQEPVDLNAELKRQRKEELKAKNGLLVDDLEAEKQKILAMTDADWNRADIARWFENAAIVGDSIIRQVRLFHFLDAPVFAEGGIHISVELPLLDEVEAAKPVGDLPVLRHERRGRVRGPGGPLRGAAIPT